MNPTHLDLFSGIGGFALAAGWAGFETIGFSEIDPYASAVLKKHWPGVPNVGDLKNIDDSMLDSIASYWENSDMSRLRDSKYDGAKALYESGLSVGDCADYYNISRQAMHTILVRRETKFRPQLKEGSENHFYRGGPRASDRAQNLTEKRIAKGLITPKPCEVCGAMTTMKDGRSAIQAHHDDYNKPLEIRWLCQPHHHEWHKHNRAIELGKEGTKGSNPVRIDIVTGGFP